ncbi:MAG: nicotinate-nicotinamide nucleotide adenylyltransferase, partial [Candidatus Parcubacteria bacterium]|nr:nicotinate-nicotinamide nucleotide adenylyltransferase [Burkholderiales bacterium]
LDARELQPGASGFTYDTVRALKQERPDAQFTLLMGADQHAKRRTWHRWDDLEQLCRVAAIERPDAPQPEGDALKVPMIPQAISSSDIRARLARGDDVSGMLPPPVLAYIRERRLYRA